MNDLNVIFRDNAAYAEGLYEQWRRDPGSVDPQWAQFFAALDGSPDRAPARASGEEPSIGVFDLIHSYRELGHLIANLDPLGHNQDTHPLLEPSEFGFSERDLERTVDCPSFKGVKRATLRELIRQLRATYCRTLGVEYMFIDDKRQREWLQERMEPSFNEPPLSVDDRKHILSKLIAAEGFEQYVHTKYVGQKRFSLEGGDALIPLLDCLVEESGNGGVEEIVMGMAHRGRLNVLANILRKPYEMMFSEFEGSFLPTGIVGDGDVKYHLGYARDHVTRAGHKVHVSLLFNPSHLEAIDPVAEGIVRAKQQHRHDTQGAQVLPLLIHGDAAFTGQGVVPETFALSELAAYRTGGTIHVIINNQIGFTTSPSDYRFTRYPSDIAKVIQVPVFHVNGDDPEAAIQAARLAAAFRREFKKDVIIDLVCYRRHGHNESDDPTFSQPVMYREIAAHTTVRDLYAERLIASATTSREEVDQSMADLREILDCALGYARDFMPRQQVFALGGLWKGMHWSGDDWSAHTAVAPEILARIIEGVCKLPEGFTPHPKISRLLAERRAMVEPEGRMDWGTGEMLALGTLLLEGTHVRFTGEDVRRGTFSHRHAALRDINTDAVHVPLDHLSPDQGRLAIIDSLLSELAVLGFEYGFSAADPHNLVIWEAQFGDFVNGAQVVIDQFISSAESKWQRMSGLVLLLPHGYEAQGPEHSSARLERFLQLCADNNMQVCNLTTPAQYFHALRRQMHRSFRKPLIIMSPKSLLRHKLAVSAARELSEGTFQPVLDEVDGIDRESARRVCLCTGKVYYDLLMGRRERQMDDIAIVRIEQLYPFPEAELAAVLDGYPAANEILWVQEEPRNMGAWSFIELRLRSLVGGRPLLYDGRDEAASPATGSYKVHQAEQTDIINRALRKAAARALRKANVG